MAFSKRKRSAYLFFVVVVLLLTVMVYSTFNAYQELSKRQYAFEHVMFAKSLDSLLNKVNEEMFQSVIHLSQRDKKDYTKVITYRELVDMELLSTCRFLQRDVKFHALHSEMLEQLRSNLEAIRQDIDQKPQYIQGNFYSKAYYQKVIVPLVEVMEVVLNEYQNDVQDRALLYYLELVRLKEYLNIEKSYVLFFIIRQQIMSDEQTHFWKNLVTNDDFPGINMVQDSILAYKLTETLQPNILAKRLEGIRSKVTTVRHTRQYDITSSEWNGAFKQRFDRLLKAQNLIMERVENKHERDTEQLQEALQLYLMSLSLSLLLFSVLIYIFYRNTQNRKVIAQTLYDIESDLSQKQKDEIREVLKKHDNMEVYRFLVNAIKEPNRAKDHFLANMSHEIRTPLNGIIGFTSILKESGLNDEQQGFLNIIEESSNSLINIVNDILDFSKVNSGKIEFETIAFNLLEKFEATVDSYAAKAYEKNIDLNLFIDPKIPTEIIGDPTKISQVLLNLMSNAIKFTSEGGKVSVSIEKVDEEQSEIGLRFAVADTGIGVSSEQQDKIFDAFSQADPSTSRKFGGTGLGLTISSKFIALMGGKLDVESVEGEGSTFFFELKLPIASNAKHREIPRYENLTVGYITQNGEEKWAIDKNFERYFSFTQASLILYSLEKVFSLGEGDLPEVIVVDHQYLNGKDTWEKLMALKRRLVLISLVDKDQCNSSTNEKLSPILYRPINYTKTMRVLNVSELSDPRVSVEATSQNLFSHENYLFSSVHALVVEDNRINQKLIKTVLTNLDIRVTIANHGAEALTLRQHESFDIIFMDIQMPIMSGLEATSKILAYEKSHQEPHVPIVALTANVTKEDEAHYLAQGMDAYLKKPIDLEALHALLVQYFPPTEEHLMDAKVKARISSQSKADILLFKETALTAKIYSAILTNLGYRVESYSSEDAFLDQIDTKAYRFILFDMKPFQRINTGSFVVEMIKSSGAKPIAFSDDGMGKYCDVLSPMDSIEEIHRKLVI